MRHRPSSSREVSCSFRPIKLAATACAVGLTVSLLAASGLPAAAAPTTEPSRQAAPAAVGDRSSHLTGSDTFAPASTTSQGGKFTKPTKIDPRYVVRVGKWSHGKQQIRLAKGVPALKKGSVFVVKISPGTPDGLVSKVASVHREKSGDVTVTATKPRLEEVVAPGRHKVKKTFTIGRQPTRGMSGKTLEGVPFSVQGSCSAKGNSQRKLVDVTGNFQGKLTVFGEFVVNPLEPRRNGVSLNLEYDQSADLKMQLNAAFDCAASAVVLTQEMPLTLIGIPFHPYFELKVDGRASADGTVTIRGQESISGRSGFECYLFQGCRDTGRGPVVSGSFDVDPISGKATLEAGVTGTVGIRIPAIADASFNGRVYGGIDADADGHPAWSTYYGARVWGRAAATLIGSTEHTFWAKRIESRRGPAIATTKLPTLLVGNPVDLRMQGSGGHGAYNWSAVDGALPDGLTLGPDGHLSGSPTTTGSFGFTLRITDAHGDQATWHYDVLVDLLRIEYHGATRIQPEEQVRGTLSAAGGTKPYHWSLDSAPAGWNVTDDGSLTSPTLSSGQHGVTVRVTDSSGGTQTRKLTFVATVPPIRNPCLNPRLPICDPDEP